MKRIALILAASLFALPVLAHDVSGVHAGHAVAAAAAADQRFVLLEGGRNFRDIGGYRTADGRTVKGGFLYRSGSLGNLTEKGQADLARMHVRAIVDLRTTEERGHDTYDLRKAFGPGYWTRDYGMSMGDMRSYFSDPAKLTAENMRAMMNAGYRTFAREQAGSYRELFARLVEGGSGPVVVNCTAGKDRTGIATALILTALGVPYATVREDFLLSNGAPGMDTLTGSMGGPLAKLPPEVIAPLVGVEGGYLDTAFAQIQAEYGTVEVFLDKELGVGPMQIAALRRNMLN